MPGLILKEIIQRKLVANLQDGGIPKVFSVVGNGRQLFEAFCRKGFRVKVFS